MAAAPDKPEVEFKWASVFIEVALRALRRVHYEHGMWGVGHHWRMDRQRAKLLNIGQGIELALETTVCAAITQEFIGSPALSGIWVDKGPDGKLDEEELRYFTIDREAEYLANSRMSVDLFVEKFTLTGDSLDNLKRVELPSFIEAKRARRWKADIVTGKAEDCGDQVQAVKDDVEKLKKEIIHRRQKCEESQWIRGHVLVWGEGHDHPLNFFKAVGADVDLHALRWLPLAWDQPSRGDIQASKVDPPQTLRNALWIGLAEVHV